LDEKAAKDFTHGKPLQHILPNISCNISCIEQSPSFAAVFLQTHAEETLLGTLELKNGRWSYGHVFVGANL
jgi:hypothetical protein